MRPSSSPKSGGKPSRKNGGYYKQWRRGSNEYKCNDLGICLDRSSHPEDSNIIIHHLLVKKHDMNPVNPSYQWWNGTTNTGAKWPQCSTQHPGLPLLKPWCTASEIQVSQKEDWGFNNVKPSMFCLISPEGMSDWREKLQPGDTGLQSESTKHRLQQLSTLTCCTWAWKYIEIHITGYTFKHPFYY